MRGADCLEQNLQDAASSLVRVRLYERLREFTSVCLNCDFWDLKDALRFARRGLSRAEFAGCGVLAGTRALVRVFMRDHERFTRDWVGCLKQDLLDSWIFGMAEALLATVGLYEHLREIMRVLREIETGLLSMEDRQPAISAFDCLPG